MQEDIGKKKKALRTAILLTLVLFILLTANFDKMFYAFKRPQNISGSEFDITEHGIGDPVVGQIDEIVGYHMVQWNEWYTDRYEERHMRIRQRYYCYVQVSGGNDSIYYICVKNEESPEPGYIKGVIKKLDEKLYERMKNKFRNMGIFETEADLEKYVLPYVIEYEDYGWVRVIMVGCILLFVYAIISWRNFFVMEPDIDGKISNTQLIVTPITNNRNYNVSKDETISINGVEHKKKYFTHIDSYICTNQDEMAIEELCRILGVTTAEAKDIIENWFEYYQR